MVPIDLVHRARGVHILGPLPAVVVRIRIPDLDENDVGHRRRLEEIVGAPLHGPNRVLQLRAHCSTEVYDAPSKQRRREGHREPELNVVAGVVVPAR